MYRFMSNSTYNCYVSLSCRVRKENITRAIEHESNGNSSAAYECYQKAVDISPSIALELIQVQKSAFLGYRKLVFEIV
jgi:hypothetical protein